MKPFLNEKIADVLDRYLVGGKVRNNNYNSFGNGGSSKTSKTAQANAYAYAWATYIGNDSSNHFRVKEGDGINTEITVPAATMVSAYLLYSIFFFIFFLFFFLNFFFFK